MEFSARKHISRFMDTLYKETVRIHEEIENKILIQKAEKARIMAEAAESNRRQIVEKGRMEQNEKFKQVILKILRKKILNKQIVNNSR